MRNTYQGYVKQRLMYNNTLNVCNRYMNYMMGRIMITSTSNAKVKYLVNVKKKRKVRETDGIFLVEGIRMFREVPASQLKEVYVSEGFWNKNRAEVDQVIAGTGVKPEILADFVFEYVSDTKSPQGVLCLVQQMKHTLAEILSQEMPLLMVLDNLQDPGNLGTILRTAEAAGVTGIIMSSDCVDIYNPKVIRSTMGSVYRMPFCYVEDLPDVVGQLNNKNICTYAAHLDGKNAYDAEEYRKPTAFLIGNEGNGLRDEVAKQAETLIRIPMCGEVESLNAAIAATVLMFEAARQRR